MIVSLFNDVIPICLVYRCCGNEKCIAMHCSFCGGVFTFRLIIVGSLETQARRENG